MIIGNPNPCVTLVEIPIGFIIIILFLVKFLRLCLVMILKMFLNYKII